MHDFSILILVGLFALGKWLVENWGKSETPPSDSPPPSPSTTSRPGAGADTDEERMRRFMEALGLPAHGVPPPRVNPRPVQPPPMARPAASVEERPPALSTVRPPSPFGPAGPISAEREARYAEWKKKARPDRPDRKPIAETLEPIAPMKPIGRAASTSETAPQMEVSSIPSLDFVDPVRQAEAAVQAAGNVDRPENAAVLRRGLQPLRAELRDPAALKKAFILREILGPPKGLQSAAAPSNF